MRKFHLVICFCLLGMVPVRSQPKHSIVKAASRYLKTNPYDRRFNTFLRDIINDTSFVIDERRQRSDTGLFYLRGHYKTFSPFFFKTQMVQLTLMEEEVLVKADSTSPVKDTIINCQILAVCEGTGHAQEDVATEFRYFQKKYSKDFSKSDVQQLEEKGSVVGEVIDYSLPYPVYLSPLSVFWGKVRGHDQFAFGAIFRLKILENAADLPTLPLAVN